MARGGTRSATRSQGGTHNRWVELLPNWASALAALLSAAAAVAGLVVINQDPEPPAHQVQVPRASLASVTTDESGIDAEGAYEGLEPRKHEVVLMMRPTATDASQWVVVEASRNPTMAGADPEDGLWSASAPVAGDRGWLATVAIIPAVPDGVTADDLLRELRDRGPDAPSVIQASEVTQVG